MLEMHWLDRRLVPDGTVYGAIGLANRLGWELRWEVRRGSWAVLAGRAVLLRTDSRQTAEAFLHGLGLAYGVLPPDVLDQLAAQLRLLGAPEPGRMPRADHQVP